MLTEGSILIRVTPSQTGHCPVVSVRSLRTDAVARALTGLNAASTVPTTLLTSLFALCPEAHRTGWQAAIAAIQGKPAPPSADTRLRFESVLEHLRFLLWDAPHALGVTPAPAEALKLLGALRTAAATVFSSASSPSDPLRRQLIDTVVRWVTGVPLLNFPADLSSDTFTAWQEAQPTSVAALFAEIVRTDLAAPTPIAFLTLTPTTAAQLLRDPVFNPLAPTLDGKPHLTGAVVREVRRPLVQSLMPTGRPTLAALFAARLTELLGLLTESPDNAWVQAEETAPREGTAVVQCARGTLLYRVRLKADALRVQDAVIAAPTEWNFAPGGPCEKWLNAVAGSDDFLAKARRVTTALDACVPCHIDIAEVPHA